MQIFTKSKNNTINILYNPRFQSLRSPSTVLLCASKRSLEEFKSEMSYSLNNLNIKRVFNKVEEIHSLKFHHKTILILAKKRMYFLIYTIANFLKKLNKIQAYLRTVLIAIIQLIESMYMGWKSDKVYQKD